MRPLTLHLKPGNLYYKQLVNNKTHIVIMANSKLVITKKNAKKATLNVKNTKTNRKTATTAKKVARKTNRRSTANVNTVNPHPISHTVAIPSNQFGGRRNFDMKLPFNLLDRKGASFPVLDSYISGNVAHRQAITTAKRKAAAYTRKTGIKLLTGFCKDGFRVWRIS